MVLVFGKYEKIRRIAQGGMGEVFLARQTGVLDRLAILKSLRPDLASESDFVEQFLDEARVAATLNHPNIVSIYDVGDWDGTYYIAMEYVPGEDLSKLWYAAAKAAVGLPFQVSVCICYEAALGLDHAHRAKDMRGNALNIVHRDVSPQNLMVRGDGVVKLVDFGIAKAANKASRTQVGMVKGKLQYMSPEQVRGEALDGRSDQFSLGVVLWEMCTGRRLFKAETEHATLNKILQTPIPKPSAHVPGFPPELEATILRMLQRDPEKRFRTVGDAAQELKGYLDRSSVHGADTSVAAFVQQILGKELEARVADLTPMEPTNPQVPAHPRPQPSPAPAGKAQPASAPDKRPSPAPHRPREPVGSEEEPNSFEDVPTRVVSEEDIQKAAKATAHAGTWWAKRNQGGAAPLRFADFEALAHAVERGELGPEDAISDDGRTWMELGEAPQLASLLRARGSSAKPSAPEVPLSSGASLPAGPRDAGSLPASEHSDEAPGLGFAFEQAEETDPNSAGFSLGSLPHAATGTWGAPEIARALAAPVGALSEVPALQGAPSGTTLPPVRSASRVPTFLWMLGGVVVTIAAVVGLLAGLAPDVLVRMVRPSSRSAEVMKAVQASRADDAQAIAALLLTMESAAQAATATSDLMAATAILHLARARQDEQRVALAKAATVLGATLGSQDAAPATAEETRARAYKLVTRATSHDDVSPGAFLALALYQAESNARVELEADAARALDAARGDALAATAMRELEVARAMLDARSALRDQERSAALAAATALGALEDPRAANMARVLRLHAAALASPEARGTDVERLREDLQQMNAAAHDDPRVNILAAALRALPQQGDKGPPAPPSGQAALPPGSEAALPATPPSGSAAPSEPPASAVTAPSTGGAPAGDAPPQGDGSPEKNASPTSSAAPAAQLGASPVRPAAPAPDTYDTVLERAERALRAGRNREAVREALKALQLRAGDIAAHKVAGVASLRLGQWAKAESNLRAVLAVEGSDCDSQFGLAEALHGNGKTEDARAAYQRYVDACPEGSRVEDARAAILRLE